MHFWKVFHTRWCNYFISCLLVQPHPVWFGDNEVIWSVWYLHEGKLAQSGYPSKGGKTCIQIKSFPLSRSAYQKTFCYLFPLDGFQKRSKRPRKHGPSYLYNSAFYIRAKAFWQTMNILGPYSFAVQSISFQYVRFFFLGVGDSLYNKAIAKLCNFRKKVFSIFEVLCHYCQLSLWANISNRFQSILCCSVFYSYL